MVQRANAREAILEAAETLVLEKGINGLTIDGVALMTGIGKGGVLYHFKYKVDLLKGLLERHCNRWDKLLREGATRAGGDIYGWMDYLVEFTFEDKGELHRSGVAIIAATASYPELLEPIRELYERRHRHILSQIVDPNLASIIVLALDGFAFFNAISVPPVDEQQQASIRVRMEELIAEMKERSGDF